MLNAINKCSELQEKSLETIKQLYERYYNHYGAAIFKSEQKYKPIIEANPISYPVLTF